MSTTKYFASFKWDAPAIARARVVEKPKTYTIESWERVWGWTYANKRISKNKYNACDTLDDAVAYCVKMARVAIEKHHARIATLENVIVELKELPARVADE